jgi:hypothetical protein
VVTQGSVVLPMLTDPAALLAPSGAFLVIVYASVTVAPSIKAWEPCSTTVTVMEPKSAALE